LSPHRGYRLPSLFTNAPHDIRRERLTTVIRLLFPSHEITAVEWLFNIRALYSLAAARFDGNTTQALRWLEPALAELTPASLLYAIRTCMPLEVTSATTHLADRITALTAHFFPGSSEYNAYLWLNDVAKLAELARLVREGDLPATFAWIAPAMDLAAEIRSATKGFETPAPESEEQLLDVWKEDFRVWRDEFSAWQHAHHADCVSQAPLAPIIIQPPPPPPSISGLVSGLRVRYSSPSSLRFESSAGGYRRRSASSLPQPRYTVIPPPPGPGPGSGPPVNIVPPSQGRRTDYESSSDTPTSYSSSVLQVPPRITNPSVVSEEQPPTVLTASTQPGVESVIRVPTTPSSSLQGRSRSRSESLCRARSSLFCSPTRVVILADRIHIERSHSRQRAAPELPLVDGGRPDIITATVKSAAVRGKPARPKRARTALASLAGE
jgi:hypothetical protein